MWSESLPHDLVNVAVDDVLKRLTEARVSQHIIQELQRMCPGMPANRTWLVVATYELWTGDKLRAAVQLFEMGATDHGMEDWMLRNVRRLRARYNSRCSKEPRVK